MKKRTLTIIIAIIVFVALVFSIYKLTGGTIIGAGDCSDTDGGIDYFVKGTASYENRGRTYTDYCIPGKTKELYEYYCRSDIAIKLKRIKCSIACKDGVCVNATQ